MTPNQFLKRGALLISLLAGIIAWATIRKKEGD